MLIFKILFSIEAFTMYVERIARLFPLVSGCKSFSDSNEWSRMNLDLILLIKPEREEASFNGNPDSHDCQHFGLVCSSDTVHGSSGRLLCKLGFNISVRLPVKQKLSFKVVADWFIKPFFSSQPISVIKKPLVPTGWISSRHSEENVSLQCTVSFDRPGKAKICVLQIYSCFKSKCSTRVQSLGKIDFQMSSMQKEGRSNSYDQDPGIIQTFITLRSIFWSS